VKEIEPTQDEWFQAIMFLSRTGQLCTDWRQEFILLSDVLGVSMLVDAINNRKPRGRRNRPSSARSTWRTRPNCRGHQYLPRPQGRGHGRAGRILDTEGRPIANAVIDVWQANDEGFYDVQQKGYPARLQLVRGMFRTGADGRYWFRAVKPKYYPIPDDGTVGQL